LGIDDRKMGDRKMRQGRGLDVVEAEIEMAGKRRGAAKAREVPELYQVVIECGDEGQQRELFERLRREGLKVRLLVL
jgi:hypothetical protein